jgi:predicted outer membrane protein
MNDQHELRRDGQEGATKLNLMPQGPQNDPVRRAARREMDTLTAAPAGSQFNRTYMDQEIAMHQQVIQLTADLRTQAQAPEVKDLIDKAHSVMLKHLGNAQTVEQKMTTTP